jgi:hypothetical protein
MALTGLQRAVCRLLADNRIASGESWRADRRLLEANGFEVVVVRERATFVEAEVGAGALLPPDEVGTCVLDVAGQLYRGDSSELQRALGERGIVFHRGRIRGAWPQLKA